jgi:hypothetical protein
MTTPLGVVFLVEGIIFAAPIFMLRCFGGNPRFGSPGSDVGGTWCCYPCWASYLEHYRTRVVWWWSGVAPISSVMTSFGGMAQRGLGGKCMILDARTEGTLFGIEEGVYGRSGEGFANLSPEDTQWFDGGDGFCIVFMRCLQRVC